MRNRLLLFLTFLAAVQLAFAQQKSVLMFGINDRITGAPIDSAQIDVMLGDSVKMPHKQIPNSPGHYVIEFDYRPGNYVVRATKAGYNPVEKAFSMKTVRATSRQFGTLYMEKQRQYKLGEASVKATRIKMLMRGDTIVYDAAAFELAEGSMLDALVAQLPGAELVGGQIKVNGKVMESLLLNGEDFFSGNPSIALQNLPSYTVKNIKVYDRAAKDDYLKSDLQKKLTQEEHMVMDVVLKKKYRRGFLGNVEGGFGLPGDMYRGKAFGLGYFGRTRIAAFANLNNIKDMQSVSAGGGNWGGGWAQDGELDLKMGGVDVQHRQGIMTYNGNATLTREEPLVQYKTSSTQFYETGNVFSRSFSETREQKTHLMSAHNFEFQGKRVYSWFKPSVDLMRNKSNSLTRQAFSDALPTENYRLQSLDSLFAPTWTASSYAARLLNRQYRAEQGNKDWLILGLEGRTNISFPNSGFNDNLQITYNAKYNDQHIDPLVSHNRIYGAASGNAGGENVLQCNDYRAKNYDLDATAQYSWWYSPYQVEKMKVWVVHPYINVSRNYADRRNAIDELEERFASAADGQIVPPSAIRPELLTKDLENSYHTEHAKNTYTPGVSVAWLYVPSMAANMQYDITFSLADEMVQENLHHNRHRLDTAVTRFAHLLQPSVKLRYQKNNNSISTQAQLRYDYSESLPDLSNRLNIISNSDPNNVYMKNPGLLRPQTHSLSLNFNRFKKQTYRSVYANASYSHTNQAIANAKRYDRATGVSTWRPENVNGNWNANASAGYNTPFGKDRRFQLNASTGAAFIHSVDYATDTEQLTRSAVDNLSLSEQVSLTCKLGKQQIGWSGSVSWLRSFSERATFRNISAFDFRTGLNGTFNLPRNWQIATDMNLLCRTGYTDATLNTTHWIWNASVARTMLKGNLTLKLNAVDLLHQLSNVTHHVNAQGQTETWVNALPNYVMLNVVYRFNIMPKQ